MTTIQIPGTPNSPTNLALPEPASDMWRVEIRRTTVAVLDRRGTVVARLNRKHPAILSLEAWHRGRWGELCTSDVFDSQGREVMAFIAGVKAREAPLCVAFERLCPHCGQGCRRVATNDARACSTCSR